MEPVGHSTPQSTRRQVKTTTYSSSSSRNYQTSDQQPPPSRKDPSPSRKDPSPSRITSIDSYIERDKQRSRRSPSPARRAFPDPNSQTKMAQSYNYKYKADFISPPHTLDTPKGNYTVSEPSTQAGSPTEPKSPPSTFNGYPDSGYPPRNEVITDMKSSSYSYSWSSRNGETQPPHPDRYQSDSSLSSPNSVPPPAPRAPSKYPAPDSRPYTPDKPDPHQAYPDAPGSQRDPPRDPVEYNSTTTRSYQYSENTTHGYPPGPRPTQMYPENPTGPVIREKTPPRQIYLFPENRGDPAPHPPPGPTSHTTITSYNYSWGYPGQPNGHLPERSLTPTPPVNPGSSHPPKRLDELMASFTDLEVRNDSNLKKSCKHMG